ncbi:MAG: hypothetical protein KatS3mg131_2023 [Candidatus Tectimicrobiota bacterium]|nr:MAG: hypothetical protein KatS3mg131_2023 [Candidatus Tectomicrobia bacterium]
MARSCPKALLGSTVLAGALLLLGLTPAQADTRQQLVPCSETHFEAGAYGQYYGMMYHGTDAVCGGDPLDRGDIGIVAGRFIRASLVGAQPFNLYEVYWVPVGGDPTTTRVKVGNLLTDCNGNARGLLRDIVRPADHRAAPPVDITARVGNMAAGHFFVYSRGPWGWGSSSSCRIPDTLNTDDGTPTGTLVNPELWGGASGFFDGVQFLSGYAMP